MLDASGHVVYATRGEITQGEHGFTWNGQDMNGNQLPDGAYTLRAVALDASGGTVDTSTSVFGKVTGVANDPTGLTLEVGATKIPVAAVIGVTGG